MSVVDYYFQSALINALIFLWLSSVVSTVSFAVSHDRKLSLAFIGSLIFGPFALLLAIFLKTRLISQTRAKLNCGRSLVAVLLVSAIYALSFYLIFVRNYEVSLPTAEILLRNIGVFTVVSGIFLGLILACFTRRVAFIEATWTVFIAAALALLLKNFADEAYGYGTSQAYFVTVLLFISGLFLIFLTLGGALGYVLVGEGRFNPLFGYERFIGLRFLMTKKSSHVVSLITVISIVAVTIACAGMIVVMSVMNGFSSDLRAKILGANAHLMVLKYGKDFTDFGRIIEKTKNIDGIKSAHPFVVNEGMISSSKSLSGAVITGIDVDSIIDSGRIQYVSEEALINLKDPKNIPQVSEFPLEDVALPKDNKSALPGVILGKEMASELQVLVGDVVSLISPVGDMGPSGPIPKARPFRVAGLFYSGMYDFDSKFSYIDLKEAQDFFKLGAAVTGVEYRLEDIENTRSIARTIDNEIGGYPFYTRDWMTMNRNMFSALQLEKIAMLIILGTLIFMASLLILVTLIMVVMEKGKEIAILKSMGATDVSIMKIFVTYGLFVGGLGAILGGGFGTILCLLIEKIGIRFDPDVYYFSNLPVKTDAKEIILVVFAAILVSFLATIPPALFAARLKPVEGLRYE